MFHLKHFISLVFLGISIIDALLKHMGTSDLCKERLKMAANTLSSWSAQVLRPWPGSSGPNTFQGFSHLKDLLMSALVTEVTMHKKVHQCSSFRSKYISHFMSHCPGGTGSMNYWSTWPNVLPPPLRVSIVGCGYSLIHPAAVGLLRSPPPVSCL